MIVHSALPPLLEAAVAEAVEATAPAGVPLIIAFDGVQGSDLGDISPALPFARRAARLCGCGADAGWVLRPDRPL